MDSATKCDDPKWRGFYLGTMRPARRKDWPCCPNCGAYLVKETATDGRVTFIRHESAAIGSEQ